MYSIEFVYLLPLPYNKLAWSVEVIGLECNCQLNIDHTQVYHTTWEEIIQDHLIRGATFCLHYQAMIFPCGFMLDFCQRFLQPDPIFPAANEELTNPPPVQQSITGNRTPRRQNPTKAALKRTFIISAQCHKAA